MAKRAAQGLQRIFWLVFSLAFGWVWLNAVLRWPHNGLAAVLAAAVLGALAFWLMHRLGPKADRMQPRTFRWLLGGGLALHGALLIFAAFLLQEVLIMDWDVVWQSLPDFLNGLPLLEYNVYYIVCNNNLGIALLLAGLFKVLGLLGIRPGTPEGMAAAILFNCFAIWFTSALVCRAAWLITRSRGAVMAALAVCLLNPPPYLWAPCFYSDTLCMPFLMGALVLFLEYRTARSGLPRLALAAGMGLLTFAGFGIKGSIAVLLVALPVQFLLEQQGGIAGALKAIAAMLITFGLLLGGYQYWQHHGVLDWNDYEKYGLPIELWFAYGSHGTGDYDQSYYELCAGQPTPAGRKAVMQQVIKENYASRSPLGQLKFMTGKAALTWGDGKYNADEYLTTPVRANQTALFTLPGQPLFMPVTYLCQAVHYLLLGLTAAGGLWELARRKQPGGPAPVQLALFGALLFLSLWETKARYALHFAPCLALCAVVCLWQISAAVCRPVQAA